MEQFLPDAITIEVKWQGHDHPCRLNLLRGDDIPVVSTELELSNLEQQYRGLLQDELQDHEQYGHVLYNLLFPDRLRNEFFRLVGVAGDRGVRFTLNIDPEVPGIHTIPWERIHIPQPNGLFPLATDSSFVFSRLLKTSNPEVTPKSRGCFRALLALANPFPETGEEDSLHFKEEIERRKIIAALEANSAKVTWDEIPKPVTLEAVLSCLEEAEPAFDILYFSGHGFWEPSPQARGSNTELDTGEAFLIFDRQDGSPDKVALATFMKRLDRTIDKKRLPRLIFLSACHTAIKANTRKALLGFGPRLVEAGCPAVICMQESVEEQAALGFASKFFSELFSHGCIDLAVNRARAAVYEQRSWQWAIPVLFMNTQDGMLFWPNERFQELLCKPYKYLRPFKREDAELFKGRESEIRSIVQMVNEQQLTVVHGPDGIGLTSLMEAGVCPRLDMGDTLAVVISDYPDLAGKLRSSLLASRLHIYLPSRDYLSPREVLDDAIRICLRRGVNRIVLVLDQFERALRLPSEHQVQICDMLVDLLDQTAILRVILVVHDNWRDALEPWQQKLPALITSRIPVGPLHTDQVVEVINTPLLTNRFLVKQIAHSLASNIIPNDLANLYEEAGRGHVPRQPDEKPPVDPAQLQVVCDWLYRETVARQKAIIEPELYNDAGRADGILARTTADTLEWDFATEPGLTRDALVSMVRPDIDRWIELPEIAPRHLDRDQVVRILDRLVDFELLDCYRSASTTYYAFANQSVQRMAIEMGGNELRLQYQAQGEIERIWRLWWVAQLRREDHPVPDTAKQPPLLESRCLATVEQLRTLSETAGHLHPDSMRVLLLLRSAIYHDEPEHLWLQWLSAAPNLLGLLRNLETDPALSQPEKDADAALRQAVLLLGLHRVPQPEILAGHQGEFGSLAWSAVSNPQRTSRQISALALSAAFPQEYALRLEKALLASESIPGRHALPIRRRAEVNGSLLDAGIPLVKGDGKGDDNSFWTWAWRFRRRMSRHGWRLTSMVVGSALGTGLALGIWYFLLHLSTWSYLTGPSLPLYAFLGAMLGAVTALGVGLAEPILLEDSREPELHPPEWRRSFRYAWLPDALGVVLGTLAFGIAHALLVIVVSIPQWPTWHMIPMGFVAGLGISLGLYGQPRVGLKPGWRGWLLRLAGAALVVAAIQFVPCLAGKDWMGINFTYSAEKFESLYLRYDFIKPFFTETACETGLGLQGWLSGLNAALLGALLSFSSAFGMDTALRKLLEWRLRKKDNSRGEK
ncbi:MAG: CHAT domain-containing protein [Anaerolineales bacterium]|jgi:hypothetical protein|nr:CHAT domain-containing protein [Anaerolineales bacterium]